ncbi:hypothetical protein EW026_g1935 [Hermanssonia centrifuga]|uniref:Deacetylase sirtuin-type domain-containing protein n=1 Tax=Hermanssonia centrifuga TaxID=98765 RepID=A0A4S4KPX8_9APHY|nr:hypothetical protein EW026_g1935 [Hermanssonia centrifuga]
MYALQVRAFIEASEVVDIDPDTIEDILDGFNGDIHVEGDSDDEEDMPDAFAEGNAGAQAQAEQEEDEEDEEFNILLEEAEIAWSDEETKLMMSDLKENGISVSCGIPDFRSRNGLYSMLQQKGEYELDDPQQMFDINYFRENPSSMFPPLIIYGHQFTECMQYFIPLLEEKGKLLRNYTQNIDTLETRAGVQRVLQCHGSFATASCINCHMKVPGNAIESDIMQQKIPLCAVCAVKPVVLNVKVKKKGTKKKKKASPWEDDSEEEPDIPAYPPGIMKPDITFFGEKLTDDFDKALLEDRPQVDLLLVIGTSLKVSPVSEILTHLRHSVPQILINKTPVKHINPDIVLLGNADDIVQHLSRKLDWELPTGAVTPPAATVPGRSGLRKRPSSWFEIEPLRVGDSHVWLFEGAEGGKWVDDIEKRSRAVKLPSTPLPSKPGTPRPAENDVESARLAKKARTT